MKAATYYNYGAPEVVQVSDVPKPQVGKGQILVRVKAAAATVADRRIRAATFPRGFAAFARLAFGVTKPRKKILGSCFSGVVEKVGEDVDTFKVGDEVCGSSGIAMGAHAEYLVVNAHKSVVKKPLSVSHDDAAGVIFGATAALFFLRDKAHVASGQTVLINGASGAVGTNAVQLAKHFGAHVTAVTSGANKSLALKLGSDEIVDYQKEDIIRSGKTYDVVLDTVGNISIKNGKKLLNPGGKLVLMVASLGQIIASHGRVITGVATEKASDIAYLLSLVESGILTVITDSTYSLDDIVAAHKRLDTGEKTGNIIIHPEETHR